MDITDILECYGGLKQIVSVSTRKLDTLEIVLTDLHGFFHPPTTLPPLQVDSDKKGKDSDHGIVVFVLCRGGGVAVVGWHEFERKCFSDTKSKR